MTDPMDEVQATAAATLAHAAGCEAAGANAVTVAILRLRAAALAEAEAWVAAKPQRDRIKRAACALCLEAGAGWPHEVTMGFGDRGPYLAAKKTIALYLPIRPQWMLFIREACAALDIEHP